MASAEVIIWATVIACFASAWLAGRWGPASTIVVVPLVWIGAVIALVARGQVRSVHDVLAAAVGLFVILIASGAGRAARERRRARLNGRG